LTPTGSRDEGFTLVELMVVVLIIGVLIAIAIPVFNAAKANAQKKGCFANQRMIEGAAQTYQSVEGQLPPAGGISGTNNWAAPIYLKDTPHCPYGAVGTFFYSIDDSGTVNSDRGNLAVRWTHGHF